MMKSDFPSPVTSPMTKVLLPDTYQLIWCAPTVADCPLKVIWPRSERLILSVPFWKSVIVSTGAALPGRDRVAQRVVDEHVRAGAAGHGVGSGVAMDDVGAGPADDLFAAGAAQHQGQCACADVAGRVGGLGGVGVDGVGDLPLRERPGASTGWTLPIFTPSWKMPTVSSVGIFQDGVKIGSVQPVGGAWSFSQGKVSDAVHTYTTQTTDAAGNVGAGALTLMLGSTRGEKIVGGAGADVIHGDAGADTMTGGAGADVFVYDSLSDAVTPRKGGAVDTITDFQNGTDKINLSDLGQMTFKGQSATVGAHQMSWYVSGSNTFVIGDVTGDGKSDFIIQVSGVHAMTGSDFLLG